MGARCCAALPMAAVLFCIRTLQALHVCVYAYALLRRLRRRREASHLITSPAPNVCSHSSRSPTMPCHNSSHYAVFLPSSLSTRGFSDRTPSADGMTDGRPSLPAEPSNQR
ncbi:hypothetical protein LX32DRAFT_639594 [Colletotrichum zoysiae]|uniref:Secreted protein n=1 Tax=Colletotrichum zoysiae TaxID=1216348 RepID=A0AAD9HIR8_9PEZI|nr:hypothetical protein LX32DRAFT_639594 [Colletotrichum zoysiae]